MNLRDKFIRNSLWSIGTSCSFYSFNFLGQILLVRLLVPHDYGVYAFCLAIREFIAVILGFSDTQPYIYGEGERQDFGACLVLNLALLGVYSLLAGLGYAYFIHRYSFDYAGMFALLSLAYGFLLVGQGLMAPLQKALDFKVVTFLEGLSSSLSLIVAIIAAKYGASLWSLCVREMLTAWCLILLGSLLVRREINLSFDWKKILFQAGFSFKTSIATGFETLCFRLPDLIIHKFLGRVTVGFFFQAKAFAKALLKIASPSTQLAFSFLTNYRDQPHTLSENLFWLNYVIVRALLPCCFVIALFGDDLFALVFGEQWRMAGHAFCYLSVYLMFASLLYVIKSTCCGIAKQAYICQGYAIAMIIFLGSLTFSHTLSWIAFSFSTCYIVTYLYTLKRLAQHAVFVDKAPIFFKPLIVSLVCYFVYRWSGSRSLCLALFIIQYVSLLLIERDKIHLLLSKITRVGLLTSRTIH